jgi:hypothetical protein
MEASFNDCAPEGFGMSRKIISDQNRNVPGALVLGFVIAFLPGLAAAATADGSTDSSETRMSISRHHVTGGRENPTQTTQTTEDYDPLVIDANRGATGTRGKPSGPDTASASQAGSFDFWIYDVDVILFNDDDQDGYFHGIDLLFDADTIYDSAEVYAVLYLSYEGGPWNEYGVTEDFWIYGASATDEYVMVTELMQGYQTGDYDILIELFDTWDGTYVASYGPSDTSKLSYLPLEDYNRDAPVVETRVVVNNGGGGGGAMDSWMLGAFLILLFASGIRRIWKHRNDTLMRIDTPAPIWRAPMKSDY